MIDLQCHILTSIDDGSDSLESSLKMAEVAVDNFQGSNNKFGYIYVLTPQGLSERAALTKRFLARKLKEYELLQAEIEALKADEMSLRAGPEPDAVPLNKAIRRRASVIQAQS